MEFKIDKGTGYMYCYNPDHPLANKAGKVLEHVLVMSTHINRPLDISECVHHIDRNRTNNDISNLQLLSHAEHARLHQVEDHGVEYVINFCAVCKSQFETTTNANRTHCSAMCGHSSRERFEITPEELSVLVWKIPTVMIAEMLGVSDVAVAKRCKKYNISKPPRGYWSGKYKG